MRLRRASGIRLRKAHPPPENRPAGALPRSMPRPAAAEPAHERTGPRPATPGTAKDRAATGRRGERKSAMEGKSVSVRVNCGGRRTIKKNTATKKKKKQYSMKKN